MSTSLRAATPADTPLILEFIRALADYEKLTHECEATEPQLRATLFGANPVAHCVLAFADDAPAGFAIYFFNYSTFLARLANARGCGRMEWSVLDWNQPAIDFYERLGARRMNEWQICRLTGAALARYA